MFETAIQSINDVKRIVVIQAENPDGDSLGSSLALEEIIGDQGKAVSMYCPIDIPRYLRYFPGWDRVTSEFDTSAELAIIVDTSADVLLGKTLETPGLRHFLETRPVVVIDHHASESTLSFEHIMVNEDVVATSHVIYDMAHQANWSINQTAAEHLLASLMSDSLGLTTPNVTAASFQLAANLTELGASNSRIEERRREFMKKAPEILEYKGKLIERIDYHLNGKLAVVHVPFEEIEAYSDKYNPGALIGDELRFVEGVEVSCVIKTYPDGKLTARLRSNIPVSEQIAGYFGGGGHAYAAGFRIYETLDSTIPELVAAVEKTLKENTHDEN